MPIAIRKHQQFGGSQDEDVCYSTSDEHDPVTDPIHGFWSDADSNGTVAIELDYPIIGGALPFHRIEGFDPNDPKLTKTNPRAIPVAIVGATNGAPFTLRLASHCKDGKSQGELSAPLDPPSLNLLQAHNVEVENSLSAGPNSYAILTASDAASLSAFLDASSIHAVKTSEVIFVNSPTLGGGNASGTRPKPGHEVFVIERPIPGVGFFGLDKKQRISENSVAAHGAMAGAPIGKITQVKQMSYYDN